MRLNVLAALLAVQLIYATLPVAGKVVMQELSSFGLAWFRLAGAALAFTCLAAMRGKLRVPRRQIPRIALIGLLGTAFNQLLYLSGLERTQATHASVLVTTIPVFAFLVAVATRKERASLLGTLGVLIAFVGVLYLAGIEEFRLSSDTALGDLLLVANSFSYAAYLVFIKKDMERHGVLAVLSIAFIAATLFSAPFGFVDALEIVDLSPKATLTLIYVLLGPTLMAYLLNAWALSRASASTVAIFIYLQPIVGIALAIVLLDEPFGVRAVLSCLAVFAGIALVSRARAANSSTRSTRTD